MGRPKENHDGQNQKEIDQIINLSVGESLIIDDLWWNAIRGSMHKYLKDHYMDISYKSFMIDEKRRIIVKTKFKTR